MGDNAVRFSLFYSSHGSEDLNRPHRNPITAQSALNKQLKKLCKLNFYNSITIETPTYFFSYKKPQLLLLGKQHYRGTTQKKLQACKNLSKNWHFIIIHLFFDFFQFEYTIFFTGNNNEKICVRFLQVRGSTAKKRAIR